MSEPADEQRRHLVPEACSLGAGGRSRGRTRRSPPTTMSSTGSPWLPTCRRMTPANAPSRSMAFASRRSRALELDGVALDLGQPLDALDVGGHLQRLGLALLRGGGLQFGSATAVTSSTLPALRACSG